MKNSTSELPSNQEPVKSHSAYTFDELREMWYLSMIQGATLWQYCQDTKKELPVSFDKGLNLVREQLKDVDDIKKLLSSNFLLIGLYEELFTSNTNRKERRKKAK